MKKLILWVAIISLCILLPLIAGAETVQSGTWGTLTWTLDHAGRLNIAGTEEPVEMDNFDIDSTEAWLNYKADIKSVVIGGGITSIGDSAFRECKKLTKVTIPDSVTRIGDMAFEGCGKLKDLVIPDTVTAIGNFAFNDCKGLTTVTIPASVLAFGEHAFPTKSKISCVKGSAADTWATDWEYAVAYLADITLQPTPVSVLVGEEVTFTVNADGADLAWQWYYQKPGEYTWTAVSKNGDASFYTFATAERHDGYTYRCAVINENGAVNSAPALLSVVTKPVVTLQPESVTVAVGETATFTLAVDRDDVHYHWYYKKPGEDKWTAVTKGGDQATYSLTAAERHNGYIYRCRITNPAGYCYSNTVTLTVK